MSIDASACLDGMPFELRCCRSFLLKSLLPAGTEKKPLVSSPGEKGASALLTLSSQDAQQATPPLVSQAQPAAYPINGPSQSMQQMVGAGLPNMPNGPMSMAPMQEGFPSTIADNYQVSPEPAVRLSRHPPNIDYGSPHAAQLRCDQNG